MTQENQPAHSEEELKLPPKFISVHPLAAKKGSTYACVICQSDGAFMCKLCRATYCCREHLLLDDLACHAILCERQAAILEILGLPLATRARPETARRLFNLRDECRRVAYLESRRHVLDCHHELALPAAERSLQYAREVHGQNSVDLVPPLLALADVATVAGAREAVSYVSRAAFLLQEEQKRLRDKVVQGLGQKIGQNYANLGKVSPGFLQELLLEERGRRDQIGTWSPQKIQNSPLRGSPVRSPQQKGLSPDKVKGSVVSIGSPGKELQSSVDTSPAENEHAPKRQTLKSTGVELLELGLENAIRDEIFRQPDGQNLGLLTSKYWSSSAKILVYEERYEEGLRAAALALYFVTLSCGVESLQVSLCMYQLSSLGRLSEKFSQSQQISVLLQAQNILKNALLNYYALLIVQIQQLIQDRKILDFSYGAKQVRALVQDFNLAEQMREEDRLAFRADIKEAIKRAIDAAQVLERRFGQGAQEYAECVVLIGIALQCICDVEADRWDTQGKPAALQLQEIQNSPQTDTLVHLYRLLYGW